MKNNVYHGSQTSGLKALNPVKSTHGISYVYATKDLIQAIVFMKNRQKSHGDFSYWIGRNPETKKIAIVERYPNAFDDVFGGISGSIYTLPGDTFEEGKTGFKDEVVSSEPVQVLEETGIENVRVYINSLADEGKLEMYLYPSRPKCVPENDEDLIERAIKWSAMYTFKRLHPKLYEKIQK